MTMPLLLYVLPNVAWGIIYLLLTLLILVVTLYIWVRPKHVDASVPGPERNKYFGVTFGHESKVFAGGEFSWDTWPTLSLMLSREYQYRTWGGPSLNIGFGGAFFNIVSSDCLQHILRDNFDNYEKGKVARKCLSELLGTGVFTADGAVWKKHRKIITAVMTKDTMMYGSGLLLKKLQQVENALNRAADNNVEIDFQDICYRMILDVFVEMAFGVELNSLQENELERASNEDSFMVALNELQYLCHQRFVDLLWELKQSLCWGERERLIRKKAKVIDRFAYDIIQRALKDRKDNDTKEKKGNINRPSLLYQCLLQSQRLNEPPPSSKDLRDMVMNFVLAGRDSTAVGLSWTLFELTRHPAVVDKIREEVQRFCGKENESISYDTVNKLEYTHAVVMEALRLHPPVPDDFKFARESDILPDGTRIPAGSCVMYSPYSINLSERIWGETVDEFMPERFLHRTEPSSFQYPTFNAGPRLCPGKPLALIEIKTTLAFLLPRFDFLDEAGHGGDYSWNLVMAMKSGFPVKVKRRFFG